MSTELTRSSAAAALQRGSVTLAYRLSTGTRIEPWGDPVGEMRVWSGTLAAAQERALAEAGLRLCAEPPTDQPYVLFTDRVWFTAELLRRLIRGPLGRLWINDAAWWESTGALQAVPEAGLYEIALVADGAASLALFEGLDRVEIDTGMHEVKLPKVHPALAHAMKPVRVGLCMAHQINHWSHVLRVNHLCLGAMGEEAGQQWKGAGPLGKLWMLIGVLAKARSLDRSRILRAVSRIGKNVKIHPTAIVEVCEIGDDCEIGAWSVVRACVLGKGVRIEEHASVLMSVVGDETSVGRYGFLNFSVTWPGVHISHGGGYQLCLFGRETFMAWDATILDLSFGRTVPVFEGGRRVDSGHHLLGAALGHRVRVGNGVRLTYGMSVPNDAFIVADAADLLREWGDTPVDQGPVVTRDGKATLVRAGGPVRSP